MSSIVVGVHGGPGRDAALDFALEEAIRRRLRLEVVHSYAIPVYGELPLTLCAGGVEDLFEGARSVANDALERGRDRVPGGQGVDAHVVVHEGDPVRVLLATAETAALLVVGTHGAGALSRGVLGSVSAACLHRSRAPVAVVPAATAAPYDKWLTSRVVVAFDGSPAASSAVEWAVSQAREWGCVLMPVVITSPVLAARGTDERSAQLDALLTATGGHQLDVRVRHLVGRPSRELLALLQPVDLAVLGSRGHGAVTSALLGSTSLQVAQHAPCPVVVVRAGETRRELRGARAPARSVDARRHLQPAPAPR